MQKDETLARLLGSGKFIIIGNAKMISSIRNEERPWYVNTIKYKPKPDEFDKLIPKLSSIQFASSISDTTLVFIDEKDIDSEKLIDSLPKTRIGDIYEESKNT